MAIPRNPWDDMPPIDPRVAPPPMHHFRDPFEYEQYMRHYKQMLAIEAEKKWFKPSVSPSNEEQKPAPKPAPKKEEVTNNAVLLLLEN